jgi:hypothetical protein
MENVVVILTASCEDVWSQSPIMYLDWEVLLLGPYAALVVSASDNQEAESVLEYLRDSPGIERWWRDD